MTTATTAFVGFTRSGPLDRPVRVRSFAEFERHFGGLTRNGALGYAVHQFFGNGGAEAVITRVIKGCSAESACVTLDATRRWKRDDHDDREEREERPGEGEGAGEGESAGEAATEPRHPATPVLEVHASEPGSWGNGLRIVVDHGAPCSDETFNLSVLDTAGRVRETFHDVSMNPHHHRYAEALINGSSVLIQVKVVGKERPDPSGTVSKRFGHEFPDLAVEITVEIGDVRREFKLHDPRRDGRPPRTLGELATLLERKLRAQCDVPGSDAFADAEVSVFGRRLRTVAGSIEEHDVVHFLGDCADDLGLEALANPPVFQLHGGDDGDPPGPGDLIGSEAEKTGIQALRDVDDVNLLNLPDLAGWESTDDMLAVLSAAERLCRAQRAFLLVDAPEEWTTVDAARCQIGDFDPVRSDHAGLYFPHLKLTDPRTGRLRAFPPSGAVAGVIARTDAERGVWKAPAGAAARLRGVRALTVTMSDRENGVLNPLGVNCLRSFPAIGPVVWGARTLRGADVLDSEWKHIPVRRLALHLEESLYRGLRWVVFEPNGEQLWQQIRLDAAAYLDTLFRRGAFAGRTPREAYFVKCDHDTTTDEDIANGIVNVVAGFAPVHPAEFVIVKIQQLAGQFGE
ncbi:phage tail sheath family protein [Actinomadura sp. 9N215]|uniref:phage tail sheath family protein n=1 Tax=Actinomadura sp. 9N215 TaxID=3375150 RepID=UPI00378BA350